MNRSYLTFNFITVAMALTFCCAGASQNANAGQTMPTSVNWTVCSPQPGSWFGSSLDTASDVNGDGYTDLLVSAPLYISNNVRSGAVFLYYGSATGFSTEPVWFSCGSQTGEEYGYSISSAGDINKDGFDDVVVGAPGYTGAYTNEGRLCVFYGSPTGFSKEPNWVVTGGQAGAGLGWSVACAGDVNADGYPDIIAGAPFAKSALGQTGRVVVYNGSSTGLSTTAVWVVCGEQANSRFGWSVNGVGDVNGDKVTDVVIGAPTYARKVDLSFLRGLNLDFSVDEQSDSREGKVYLFTGSKNGLGTNAAWSAEGAANSCFGSLVAGAGDVNGDKLDDVMIGSAQGSNELYCSGSLALYNGTPSGLAAKPSWLHHGTQVWTTLDRLGVPIGDINDDGYADILMIYPFFDTTKIDDGRVELYLGGKTGLGELPSWTIHGQTECEWLGISAAAIGKNKRQDHRNIIIARASLSNGLDCATISVWTNLVVSTNPCATQDVLEIQQDTLAPGIAFMRALDARLTERLDEALLAFQRIGPKVARKPESRPNGVVPKDSLFWLGRLQARFGDLYSALYNIEEFERLSRKELNRADSEDYLSVLIETIHAMVERHWCLMELGKAASAHHVLDMILLMREELRHEQVGGKRVKNSPEAACVVEIELEVAGQLLRAGNREDYERTMLKLLQQAKSGIADHQNDPWESRLKGSQQIAYRHTLDALAQFAYSSEEFSAAVVYSKERAELPVCEQYGFEDRLAEVRHAKYLSYTAGFSKERLDQALVSLEKLRLTRDTGFILRGQTTVAEMVYDLGRTADALELLDRVISEAHGLQYRQTRAEAQVVRARALLKSGRPAEALRDCFEALALRRALGLKHLEPDIYETYALALDASGQTTPAIQTWNCAFELCMNLNMHFRALHMLLGLASLYVEHGNAQEAAGVWNRIDAFLRDHPKMPAPTMARIQKERGMFATFMRDRAHPLAASGIEQPAQDSGAGQQPKVSTGNQSGQDLPAGQPAALGFSDARLPIMVPTSMISQVGVGEPTRARFLVYNPHATTVTGELVLNGVSSANWSVTGMCWSVDVTPGMEADRKAWPLSLPPGEAGTVFLRSVAAVSNVEQKITLLWNGATNAIAEWSFGCTGTLHDTSFVNVSYEETNPFFYSSFYHEIHYRGTTETVRNIKATTSVPCRVEFVSNGRILAVDANGDGDFEDEGDVLNQDLDSDGYPDFLFNRTHSQENLEVFVYPGAQNIGSKRELEVHLFVRTEDGWQHQGDDILRLQ